jgi:hypothetical protein
MAQSSHGFEWTESDIFLRSRLDDPNHVEMPDQIAVFAQRILGRPNAGAEQDVSCLARRANHLQERPELGVEITDLSRISFRGDKGRPIRAVPP